jgi:hypothetical protein
MTENAHQSTDVETSATPSCFTVTEIMDIYRISRCTAYAQARQYLRRGPGHGIPCVKLGNSVRFPVAWIEAHIGRSVAQRSDPPPVEPQPGTSSEPDRAS